MTPRLTVVVPFFNVEQYLEECLRSIAAQTLPDLDVVMVDDGSTDTGPELARAFAARDPRFRLVRQENGGLGHARNTGARNADPEASYLTFIDSDDVLPPRAYEQLVALLERSGSDFATGNVYRLTTQGRSQAWQHRGMTKTVTRTHVTRDLGLLSDRVAWNKVFRRTFWDKHTLAFPEGVLYEDTPLTIPAHFLADAVDVLHEHVYYWRIREGSITRRRTDVRGVRDRIAAVDGVSRFLADPANTRFSAFKRDYDRSVLTDDLLYFIEALPMAGPEYHRVFMSGVGDYLSRVDPALYEQLPVELRLRWHLIREGRLTDLLTVLAHERHGGRTVFDLGGPPLRKRAVVVRPDGSPVPLPRAAATVTTKDLPVTARLREVEWRDGKLVLKGFAYIRNVDARTRRSSLKTAVAMSGRRKLLLPVRTVRVPEVTDEQRQERHCYDWSGFEITVDPARLRTDGRWKAGQWRIGVVVAGGSAIRPAALRADEAGAGSSPVPFALDDDTRLVPWYKDGRLHLSVEPVTRRLTAHCPGPDGALRLDLAVRDRKLPVSLRLAQQATGVRFDYPLGAAPDTRPVPAPVAAGVVPAGPPDPGEWPDLDASGAADGWRALTALVALGDLGGARPDMEGVPKEVAPETTATWSAEVVFADGGTARVSLDRPLAAGRYPLAPDTRRGGAPRELSVEGTAAGNLVLRDRTPQAVVDRVCFTPDGRLLVSGELPPHLAVPAPAAPGAGRAADAPAAAAGAAALVGPGDAGDLAAAAGAGDGATPPDAGDGATPTATAESAAVTGVTAEPAAPTLTAESAALTDPAAGTPVSALTGSAPLAEALVDARAGVAPGTALPGTEGAAGAPATTAATAATTATGAAEGGPRADEDEPVRLMLRHGTYGAETGADIEVDGARFGASLHVGALPHAGRWYLHLRADGTDTPVRIAPAAMAQLPLEPAVAEGERPIGLNRRFHDHLFVSAGSAVPAADRGPYRQRLLRERRYPVLLRRPLTATVLYSSFDGRDCGDSPRAVHEELVRRGAPLEHVWVVADRSVPVPASARSVIRGSHAWYEALARSRHVLTNTHLPVWFRRREGQQVVQTWHGTPVKRFGQDLAGTLCADLTHVWPQPRQGDQWSVLLSPNAPSTPELRRALDFHGEVAETGLPRTDPLNGKDRDRVAEKVRAAIGVPADRTVVLYAPTIRDDEAYDAAHHRLHLAADLAALKAELNDTHVLLIRAHPLVADTVRDDCDFAYDVSGHPDLAELLLAADVLVTDYSSVLVDFAVTGRPILLYTPDLAYMRDTLRGFTFDFEERAPGPLLSRTAELVAALRDPAGAVRPHAAAYDAFRAAFCHLDDGRAASRVADLILREPRI